MYSLNVPVPGAIAERAWALRSQLLDFEQLRDELTLVIKRLPVESGIELDSELPSIRDTLSGVDPFPVSLTGIDTFCTPPAGSAPVVYFVVESPAIHSIHERFIQEYGVVPDIEGEAYTPHITLARGGGQSTDITAIELEPITWTVDRLLVWDSKRSLPAAEFALPVQ